MQERFTEYYFTAILLGEFQKHGIYDFSQIELEKELNYYRNNPKYKPLFINIDCRHNRVNLSKSFGLCLAYDGMYYINPDLDRKYIHPNYKYFSSETELKAYEKLKDYANLMIEMINEYVLRKKVASESIINLKIHGLNPNREYILARGGRYATYLSEQNIITDGDIKVALEGTPGEVIRRFWSDYNSYWYGDTTTILNYKVATGIDVNHATFAIRQVKIDNQVVIAEIFSEILDEEKLSEMANFALLEDSLEQPLVRVRKQK